MEQALNMETFNLENPQEFNEQCAQKLAEILQPLRTDFKEYNEKSPSTDPFLNEFSVILDQVTTLNCLSSNQESNSENAELSQITTVYLQTIDQILSILSRINGNQTVTNVRASLFQFKTALNQIFSRDPKLITPEDFDDYTDEYLYRVYIELLHRSVDGEAQKLIKEIILEFCKRQRDILYNVQRRIGKLKNEILKQQLAELFKKTTS